MPIVNAGHSMYRTLILLLTRIPPFSISSLWSLQPSTSHLLYSSSLPPPWVYNESPAGTTRASERHSVKSPLVETCKCHGSAGRGPENEYPFTQFSPLQPESGVPLSKSPRLSFLFSSLLSSLLFPPLSFFLSGPIAEGTKTRDSLLCHNRYVRLRTVYCWFPLSVVPGPLVSAYFLYQQKIPLPTPLTTTHHGHSNCR